MPLAALLSDEQWAKIEPLLPILGRRPDKKGRPWVDNRRCLEGILWVLKTGAQWEALPAEYPSDSTCWRRLKLWEEQGVWVRIWRTFLGELDDGSCLEWGEGMIDGSFAPAKKGAAE